MNGLGFPGTGTLQLMPVVKDGRPFLPSPLIIFPVALVRLHSDSISRHESFCLIFFTCIDKKKKKLLEMVAVH